MARYVRVTMSEDAHLATAWRIAEPAADFVRDFGEAAVLPVRPAPVAVPARPLRIALFSGNYNYVRDGANQALNRLVAFLEAEGHEVRVYSPTSDTPAFPPAGTLVSVPSFRIPGRAEYRMSTGLTEALKRDVRAFAPDLIHLSAPDPLNHAAKRLGKALGIPVVASVHTRFETYFEYYGLGWLRRAAEGILRRFYAGLDEVFVTTETLGRQMCEQGLICGAAVWSRGVDKLRFNPAKRNLDWRRSFGIADDDFVIAFVGRLVLEKGLDTVAAVANELTRRGLPHKLLIVGDGPARQRFAGQVPGAIFTGFLDGDTLPRAYASAELLINPSTTETFGNINLEAMASGIPVVAAAASGNDALVVDGATGRLVPPVDIAAYADAIAAYMASPAARRAAGAAGLARAGSFDWDSINGAVLARYRELVAAA